MPTGKAGHFAATAKALSLFKQAAKPKSPPELVRLALEALRPLASRNAVPSDKVRHWFKGKSLALGIPLALSHPDNGSSG